ncbi:MAG TPA: hypothetical protein VM681_04995 [Candidatus Thermoplasmatota archaeon]|nr:hypothetical protein [Candidatus Thermoplasmatota archaeon]
MKLALLLAAALPLAGCLADAPAAPPQAPASEALAPATSSEPPPAEPSNPAPAGATDTTAPPAGAPRNVSEPIGAEGTTEGELCPGAAGRVERCAVFGAAQGTPIALPVVARPTFLHLRIDVDEPPYAPRCAYAVLYLRQGEEWVQQGDAGKVVLGGSPLVAGWILGEYPPGSEFRVGVYCGEDRHVQQGLVTLYSGFAAAFRLQGELFHETLARGESAAP